MNDKEYRKLLLCVNRDLYGLFKKYISERDALDFQQYIKYLCCYKDFDTSVMIMLIEKLRNTVYMHKSADGKYGYYFVDAGMVAVVFGNEDFRNIVNAKSSFVMMDRDGIYFKNGRKLSSAAFHISGRYLFNKYLGYDYAVEFSDYMIARLFFDDVETTELYYMICELKAKIASTGKGEIGRLDYEFIRDLMECEEMKKIIEESSFIMDNDDE